MLTYEDLINEIRKFSPVVNEEFIKNAYIFSLEKHGTQIRESGAIFFSHPLEVAQILIELKMDQVTIAAGLLHDTVEDTAATIDDIRNEFGEHVAKLVSYETEDKRGNVNKADTWVDRKKEAIETIKNIDEIGGKMVCLGDKVSNLRSFHLGLLQDGEEFWNNFNQKDPLMHHWYYNSLKEALVELKEYAVYKEFAFVIDTIFSKYLKENE